MPNKYKAYLKFNLQIQVPFFVHLYQETVESGSLLMENIGAFEGKRGTQGEERGLDGGGEEKEKEAQVSLLMEAIQVYLTVEHIFGN